MENPKAVEFCKEYFGSLAGFARAIKVERQVVWQWKMKGYIPPKYAFEIEKLTDGRVPAAQVIEEANEFIPRARTVITQEA